LNTGECSCCFRSQLNETRKYSHGLCAYSYLQGRAKKTVKTTAKTAEKSATKGKEAGAAPATRSPTAAGAKKVLKTNPLPRQRKGLTLGEVIETLPQPPNYSAADRSTWLHRHGIGLRFMRQTWSRYEHPCYWEVTRFRPSLKAPHRHPSIWGVKFWQGRRLTGDRHRRIPSVVKRGWRLLLDERTPPLVASNPATPKHRWGTLEYPHRETMQHWMTWRTTHPKRRWGTSSAAKSPAAAATSDSAAAGAGAQPATTPTATAASASASSTATIAAGAASASA